MGNMSPVVSQNVQMAKPRAAAAVAQVAASALLGNFPFLPHTHTYRERGAFTHDKHLHFDPAATGELDHLCLLSRTPLDFSWFSQFPMLFFPHCAEF